MIHAVLGLVENAFNSGPSRYSLFILNNSLSENAFKSGPSKFEVNEAETISRLSDFSS